MFSSDYINTLFPCLGSTKSFSGILKCFQLCTCLSLMFNILNSFELTLEGMMRKIVSTLKSFGQTWFDPTTAHPFLQRARSFPSRFFFVRCSSDKKKTGCNLWLSHRPIPKPKPRPKPKLRNETKPSHRFRSSVQLGIANPPKKFGSLDAWVGLQIEAAEKDSSLKIVDGNARRYIFLFPAGICCATLWRHLTRYLYLVFKAISGYRYLRWRCPHVTTSFSIPAHAKRSPIQALSRHSVVKIWGFTISAVILEDENFPLEASWSSCWPIVQFTYDCGLGSMSSLVMQRFGWHDVSLVPLTF